MAERDNYLTDSAHRNTLGHPTAPTGPMTGGVVGHVKAEPLTNPDDEIYGGPTEGLHRHNDGR